MTRLITAVLTSLLLVSGVSAQLVDDATHLGTITNSRPGIGIQPANSAYSLLDLSRITWSHSYSVSFFSGGSTSGSVGLWTTQMNYEISSKLHLALNIGLLHNPGALWSNGEKSEATVLPGFRLDYQPSRNVFMSVSFQQYSGYYSPYSTWRGYR
jgi:hypothetical protein